MLINTKTPNAVRPILTKPCLNFPSTDRASGGQAQPATT
jgi:hypothetical protein